MVSKLEDEEVEHLYAMVTFVEGKKNIYQIIMMDSKNNLLKQDQLTKKYQVILDSFQEIDKIKVPKSNTGTDSSSKK